MTDTGTLGAAIAERRQAALELEQHAEQARVLGSKIEDMKVDLQRAEARHAAFAAVGKERVEIPLRNSSFLSFTASSTSSP